MWAYIALAVFFIIIIIAFTFAFQPQNVQTMNALEADSFPFPIYIINLDRKPERYTYVSKQLDAIGLTGYSRFSAVDGFKVNIEEMRKIGITQRLIDQAKGLGGCASSHIKLWRQIAETKSDWTLILEDDAHFHPDFLKLFPQYWKKVPNDAIIVFPGYGAPDGIKKSKDTVISSAVMCLQGYMLNWKGAQYLLDNLLPINDPVDIAIVNHFRTRNGSYIFNGNVKVGGIRPDDYKEANGRKCMFNGIIYQNHQEQGSTIHSEKTVFE